MAYSNIDKPSKYFNTVLYTGDGTSNRAITGVGFKPDLVWHKSRSNAFNHYLTDAVRGAGYILLSNLTDTEANGTAGFKSFDTDGFTLTQEGNLEINKSAVTYTMWNWLGANTTASNTNGSITSTVSANTTSGFSIVSYTGTGANASIGHGLGKTPAMIICKSRSDAEEWATYHQSLGTTKYIVLNSTAGANSTARFYQAPTSSLFYVDNGYGVNKSSATYIAYCFAEVKGYSKFSSYVGNGSTDGTFVYTGFKPAFVMFKVSSTTENWVIRDNKRDTFNNVYKQLLPNASSAEDTSNDGRFSNDFLSNGFKLRATHATTNQSGATYIYMAFAENPFVSSKGLPCTAR